MDNKRRIEIQQIRFGFGVSLKGSLSVPYNRTCKILRQRRRILPQLVQSGQTELGIHVSSFYCSSMEPFDFSFPILCYVDTLFVSLCHIELSKGKASFSSF